MILTGLIYTIGFKVIEQEVRDVGQYSIVLGITSIFFSYMYKNKYIRYTGILSYSIICLIQILPILWWVIGVPITDTPNVYMGNKLFSLPHIFILILCIWCITSLMKFDKVNDK